MTLKTAQLCTNESFKHFPFTFHIPHFSFRISKREPLSKAKAIGQLVVLGFAIADFTPAPYQRPRLGRPSMEFSSCGRLRT